MSQPSARRARILRVRQLEHRLSVARLNNAAAEVTNLKRIGARITNLRITLNPDRTLKSGTAFQAMYEMAARLDDANAQLAAPIDQAETTVRHFEGQRNAARIREDGAERLHAKSVREESYQSALRADANRPFQKRTQSGGRSEL
jgi:uncharacterized protein (UPF0210 family)